VVFNQKHLLIYGGIALAASGVVTIFLIYQGMLANPTGSQEFTLEQVHANPQLVMHIHSQIEVSKNGQKVLVPAEIGINPELWHDHSLDEFGPSKALLAPLHTHDESGTIHIESVTSRDYTLGEFLSIWGIDGDRIVRVTTGSGEEVQDFQNHVLLRNEKLAIEISD
jgi:hypothetical protein